MQFHCRETEHENHSHYLFMLVGFKRNEHGCSGDSSSQTKQVAMDTCNSAADFKNRARADTGGMDYKGEEKGLNLARKKKKTDEKVGALQMG